MSSAVFPALAGLEWNVAKVASWNSRVQGSVGGYETRIALQSLPRWRWTLQYEFLRQATAYAEFQTLADFFNARKGRYDSFLYTDPTDSVIADTSPATRQVFGTGDGSDTTFQLARSLKAGGVTEPVYNLNGTPKIYKNDVLLTVVTDYTVSATGLVTFVAAPAAAAVLTWSGAYYWRARFEQDASEFTLFANQYWQNRQVSLISILGS